MASSPIVRLRMIFPENRLPLFGIMRECFWRTPSWVRYGPSTPGVAMPVGELCGRQPHRGKLSRLPLGDAIKRKILDRLVEQLVVIKLGAQMQKDGAKPDRGAIHEHEFARHRNRTFLLERLMDAERLTAAVFRGLDAISDSAHPVVEERRIDEARPDIQRVDQIARQPAEAPGLIGVHD